MNIFKAMVKASKRVTKRTLDKASGWVKPLRPHLRLRYQMSRRYRYGALVAMTDECCSLGLGSAQGVIIARRVTNAKGAEVLVSFWYDKKLRADWFCPFGIVVLKVRATSLQESEAKNA